MRLQPEDSLASQSLCLPRRLPDASAHTLAKPLSPRLGYRGRLMPEPTTAERWRPARGLTGWRARLVWQLRRSDVATQTPLQEEHEHARKTVRLRLRASDTALLRPLGAVVAGLALPRAARSSVWD